MRNRIFSAILSLTVFVASLGLINIISLNASAADFNEADHLIEIQNGYNIISLDKNISFNIYTDENDNNLYYEVIKKDYNESTPIIGKSRMGVKIGSINFGTGAVFSDAQATETNRTYSHMGNRSELTDNGVDATLSMTQESTDFFVDIRVYNDGVAFRYRFPAASESTQQVVNDEYTEFKLPSDVTEVWAGKDNRDYEPTIEKFNPSNSSTSKFNSPLTAVLPDDKGFIAVLEAGLTGKYAGTNLIANGSNIYQVGITWDGTKNFTVTGDIETGWRLINLADDLNDLVNNYNVFHVNDAPDSELFSDTSWIVPGRSTWTWLSDYGNPSCKDPIYQEEAIIGASKLGFEYHVIDEGYKNNNAWWTDSETKNYVPALKKLGDVGKNVNIKPILWTGVTNHNGYTVNDLNSAKGFIDLMKDTGMAGGKIDFWPGEDNVSALQLQIDVLKLAAENKMIMNYHGLNKPTGLSVTYPNELTREAIRGLENIGSAGNTNYTTQTTFLTRQLFTRYLAGHADWTPASNNAMQIASLVLINSPLNVIATPASIMLQNEAVEMIKSIPTVWDQTIVLDGSKISEMAVYAKESKGTWFLGGISNSISAKTLNIELDDFLGEGAYNMEMWVDRADGTKEKIVKKVANSETLTVDVPVNRGFVARFSKIEFNSFGGEILFGKKLDIKTADDNAVVKFTTDGTDPLTSSTAVVYSEAVQLDESCKVRAAIASGDGEGIEISSNFNIVGDPTISVNTNYNDGSTTVELYSNFESDIYYTLNGTEPTTSSTKYSEPFTISGSVPLNVIAVPKDGGENVALSRYVFVMVAEAVSPDAQLTDAAWLDATTGWNEDPASKDQNTKRNSSEAGKISIKGKTYDRGISTNAIGHFVYDVPQDAKRFVGVVGVDDVAKLNANDGHKASGHLIIYFDDVEYLRTPVFRPDESFAIDIAIPDGAKKIKILLSDGGDGNTCDNISMGNPGWMFTGYENPIELELGDVDGDGKLSVTDIVKLRSVIMGDATLTADQRAVANVDEDSEDKLTVADIVALRALIMNY